MQSHNHTITTERAAEKSGQQGLGVRCLVLDEDGQTIYDSQSAHGPDGIFADDDEATEHATRWLAAMNLKRDTIEHLKAQRGLVLGEFLAARRAVEEGHKAVAKQANAAAKAEAARREQAERDQAQPRVHLDYEPSRGDWRLTVAPSELDGPLEQAEVADAIEGLDELDDELGQLAEAVDAKPRRKAPPKPGERPPAVEDADDGPVRPVAEMLVDAVARAKVSEVIERINAVRPSPATALALHQAELARAGKPRSKLLDRLLEEPPADEPDPWAALLLCSRLHPREDVVEAALPMVRDVAVVRWLSSWELSRKKHSRAGVVAALEERLGQLLELDGGAA